ncbi:MAG: AAA family ATPase [Candidatus Peregrinibacteria bacterium]|nr:AAA family ATPase [Candidatus Peregrinibacteria bacterium]
MDKTSPNQAVLTSCQAKGLDVFERQGNVFLTGAAGTGKSFLLQRYLAGKPTASFPIVASTGAAAVLVGGRTFHSFFGLGILEGGPDAAVLRALRSRKLISRLNRACCVIIDEVSMLPGTTLKAAETVARRARGSSEPWGGLRIIAVGDFAQLPPVTPDKKDKDWAFLHPVWQESDFQPALLSTVMRTQDIEFLTILNFVREGIVNDQVHEFLNRRITTSTEREEGTRLYPHRAQAEAYNLRRLEAIARPLRSFQTQYTGKEQFIEAAKKVVPIPETLLLKEGALIMMRKNDITGGLHYVNGSLGYIQDIMDDSLGITLFSGEEIEVGREKFSYLDGDGNEVIAAWNFPVTLAWATTIHKAQGASLDRMIVDLHQLWEPGQAYVALSRVRSGSGLMIERWSPASILAEPLVTQFYNTLADQAQKYVPRPLYVPPRAMQEVPSVKRKVGLVRQQRAQTIARLIKEKVSLENIAEQWGIKQERVILYIEKLLASGAKFDIQYLTSNIPDRQKISDAFEECGHDFLKPVFEALGGRVPYETLRLVRCARYTEILEKADNPQAEKNGG